jgi:hypothetical protein
MLAVEKLDVSIVAGPESRVVTLPEFELVALDLTDSAAVFVQLKQ